MLQGLSLWCRVGAPLRPLQEKKHPEDPMSDVTRCESAPGLISIFPSVNNSSEHWFYITVLFIVPFGTAVMVLVGQLPLRLISSKLVSANTHMMIRLDMESQVV